MQPSADARLSSSIAWTDLPHSVTLLPFFLVHIVALGVVLSWLGIIWDVRTPPPRVLEAGTRL